MELGVVGDGPAVEAITAAVGDHSVSIQRLDPSALSTEPDAAAATAPDTGAVVESVDAAVFSAANISFDRWVAVEIGGIGGRPDADLAASVSTFGPESACYECLTTRVAAHSDGSAPNNLAGDDPAGNDPAGDDATIRLAGAIAGHRLLSLCASDAAGGRIKEVPGPERPILPVPHCDCAEPSERELTLTHRDVAVEDALARAEQAVDDRIGLLSAVGERESFPVPYYIAELCETTGFSETAAAEFAAGTDTDWNRAYMNAIGEGLERYSAGVYRASDATTAPETDVTNPIPPRRFVCPDGFETPTPDDQLAWVTGQKLPAAERVSLPAEFVRFPPSSQRFRPAITTGLGAGNSTIEAILAGLYETIERDATMLGWYSTFQPLGLSIADDGIAELQKRARAESLTVSLLLVTQDIDVPVVAAAVHREEAWPQFAAGSAANLAPTTAARSALAEALQNWMELRAMGPDAAATQGGAIATYADFPPAAQSFVDPSRTVSAESLGEPALSGHDEVEAICDRLAAVDLAASAVDVTTRDLAALGFAAVRVLVPAAQPLFTGTGFFGERARTVPASMGFDPRLDRDYHPYP